MIIIMESTTYLVISQLPAAEISVLSDPLLSFEAIYNLKYSFARLLLVHFTLLIVTHF